MKRAYRPVPRRARLPGDSSIPSPASTSSKGNWRGRRTRSQSQSVQFQFQSQSISVSPTPSTSTSECRSRWASVPIRFGDRADTAPTANSTVADATIEHAATARMPELDSAATAAQQTLEPTTDVSEPAVDDEHHTLTIVEIDMLREDYEAEHTLTQAGSQSLRDALADLKATQAALAAGAATATLEMPQPEAETMETQQTQRLRSSR